MFIQVGVTRTDTHVIQAYKHMRKQISLSTDTRKKEGLSNHHLGGKLVIDVEVYVKPIGGGDVVV